MASLTPLDDIDDKFLQCAFCLDQLKEPKLLPCLHRYCKDCLEKMMAGRWDTKLRCPTCREEHELPAKRIEGFKTDFHTKSIIEFIQLQNSLEQELIQVCVNCTEELKMTAYCFKCHNFLCHTCEKHHMTSMIVIDHRPHILSLSSVEAKHLTIETLMSLKAAPRCHTHPDKLSELCCSSCKNLPICVACTYGEHRGHDLKEVTSLAKIEKEKLTTKFEILMQHKDRIYKMEETIRNSKKKLNLAGDKRKSELQDELHLQNNKAKTEIIARGEKLKQQMTEMREIVSKKISSKKRELEQELKNAQDNYDLFCVQERKMVEIECNTLLEKNEEDKEMLHEKLKTLNTGIQELLTSLEAQVKVKSKEIEETQDHFDGIVKRFENLTATTSRIIAAKHDWTYVQCIPETCDAIDRFIEEVKNQSPDLTSLSTVTSKSLSSFLTIDKVQVNVSEEKEFIVNIANMRNRSLQIDDITGSRAGSLVTTGSVSNQYTHITVINMEGKVLRQDTIRSRNVRDLWRCCDLLSESVIVTVCTPSEIGLYNITDGSYMVKDIRDLVGNWSAKQLVACVAVEAANDTIIVGCQDTTNLYVFDAQLKYIYTMALPSYVHWPREITVHEGKLIVCDHEGRKAYTFITEGSKCKLLHEIPTPGDGHSWRPTCVCTDKNGFIYMLYRARVHNRWLATLVQYTQDGRQILTTKSLNKNAEGITTVDTRKGEKLVVSTHTTRELIVYGLVVNVSRE